MQWLANFERKLCRPLDRVIRETAVGFFDKPFRPFIDLAPRPDGDKHVHVRFCQSGLELQVQRAIFSDVPARWNRLRHWSLRWANYTSHRFFQAYGSGHPYFIISSPAHEDPVLHRMDDLMRAVALAVVQKPYRLTAEEVRFVRKYLHLTGQEFAKLLKGRQLDAFEVGARGRSGRRAKAIF
jgi:DNA-binding transcriptional regulator YiaG